MGRSKPPNPLFGKIKNAAQKHLHKGHLLALQLGGPDSSLNIVAQKDAWNAYGAWRHFEKYLYYLSRFVMGFSLKDKDYTYYNQPKDYTTPLFCVYYLILPSN